MNSRQDSQTTRYPLHVTIAVVFSGLFLVVGLALISYNYHESRKMALLGADRFLASTSERLETTVSDLYNPVRNLVDVTSRAVSSADVPMSERMDSLAFLSEPLRLNANLSAIFVGYEDGDFFLVRRLEESWRAQLDVEVPPETYFVVQSIDRGDDIETSEAWLFFDEDLKSVGRMAVESTGFDPRQRQWYSGAMASEEAITSDFYVFFTTHETGLTVARKLADGGGAVGADLALADLERALARQKVTPSTKIAVVDSEGGVIALSEYRDEIPLVADEASEQVEMPVLSVLGDPVYQVVGERFEAGNRSGRELITVEDRDWLVSTTRISTIPEADVFLAVAVPRKELLAPVKRVRVNGTLISLALLVGAVTLVVGVSRNISKSLGALAQEAEMVREFRLDTPPTPRSRIREVDDLGQTMALMKSSIQQFLDISQALSGEKDYRRVLEMVLAESIKVSNADGGSVLMLSEDQKSLEVAVLSDKESGEFYGGVSGRELEFESVELHSTLDSGGSTSVDRATAVDGRLINIQDIDQESGFDITGNRSRFDREGRTIRSLLSVPLQNQADEVIGALQLYRSDGQVERDLGFRPEIVSYIKALASDAAVALDIRRLLKAQRDLLDSLILMIAGAIDAKSPYTHGHCQRVPVAARMLAEVAHAAEHGKFADFSLSEDGWYQLHLASWLHDCGKVTTPEYVVDKATKLETIYNRIHEIRMRFEVLWRDAEIDYYRDLEAGVEEEVELKRRLESRHAEVKDDFEFVAECNRGEQVISEERADRLRLIASTSWLRHLDDRLGLSHGELLLLADEPSTLPTLEPLLADRTEHIIPRTPGQSPFGDEPHGFRMDVPEFQYNRGELHNLSIPRGTLTAEERFKINEHVIQTIRMLERLPFPRELGQVPDWAGNHHEKLDGTGYPRRLSADELSIPERIMAIADVFEALTARDRPYHAPRPLSQALTVMSSMCSQGHLCPDLFELFLNSGAFLDYGQEYLDPSQLDEVDIEALIEVATN